MGTQLAALGSQPLFSRDAQLQSGGLEHRHELSDHQVVKDGTGETGKCLCKINFILPSKILNHPFHIIDEIAPAVVGGEVNPFVLHKTP